MLEMQKDKLRTGNDMPTATWLINGRAHTRTQLSRPAVEAFLWLTVHCTMLMGSKVGQVTQKKGHMGGVSALSLIGTTEDWLSEKCAVLAREI